MEPVIDDRPVVLLDWHRTLSVSRFWETWAGSDDPDRRDGAERLGGTLFGGGYNDLLEAWMRGRHDAEAVVAQIAAEAGVEPALALHGLREGCEDMRLLSPAILPLIARLRANGVRVGIATDNMDTFSRWTVPALGLDRHVDVILNSWQLGAGKGDPVTEDGVHPFFGDFLATLAPDTSVFLVDDSETTAPVVEAVGIAFCQITPERDVVWWLESFAGNLVMPR